MAAIDHLVLATPHLEPAVEEVAGSLGISPAPGGQHVGLGTRNYLLGLDREAYLEVIGPDADQLDPPVPRPFGIDLLERPRLVAWAARVDDLEEAIASLQAAGYEPGDPVAMARATPSGATLRWRLTFPTGEGPVHALPFLIDWGASEHPAVTSPGGARLVSFTVEHPDPAMVVRLLDALGLDVDVAEGSSPRLLAEIDGPAGRLSLG